MAKALIGVLKDKPDGNILAFRVLDTESRQYMDIEFGTIRSLLDSGKVIDGLEIDPTSNEIVGSNGNLSRYCELVFYSNLNRALTIGKSPAVILLQYPDDTYDVAMGNGSVCHMTTQNVIEYSEYDGLANGKVIDKGNGAYISAIKGSYRQHKSFKDMEYGDRTKAKMNMLNVKSYKLDDSNFAYFDRKDGTMEQEISLGRGCLGVAERGFEGHSLKKITCPNTCIQFGVAAFRNCANLESINIPEGTEVIPNYMFEGCKSLREIDLPNSVRKIERSAFKGSGIRVIRTGRRRVETAPGSVPIGVKMVPRRN